MARARWEYIAGMGPHRVVAFEDERRGGVVTLRWHVGTAPNRKRVLRALGWSVRGPRGGIDADQEKRAQQMAERQYQELLGKRGIGAPSPEYAPQLTIWEGWQRACDQDTGKWNQDTPHRREVARAVARAMDIWGRGFTWNQVDRGAVRKLWRRELQRIRAKGHDGKRGALQTLDLVLAVGAWLRDEQMIDPTAAVRWKGLDAEFLADAGDKNPSRPRYTADEYRRLFDASWRADERYGLLYNLGAEYRLGQVVRARRSNLDRAAGRLTIPGRGKKMGAVIVLTAGQRADVERVLSTGYLAGLETAYNENVITDYPLWPGGQLPATIDGELATDARHATRDPIDRSAFRAWHREAERLAGIPHVPGRGPYASRRGAVDAAKEAKISREGLQPFGGWADAQTPDAIYADRDANYARVEAAEVRAKIRGEVTPEPAESSQTVAPNAADDVADTTTDGASDAKS